MRTIEKSDVVHQLEKMLTVERSMKNARIRKPGRLSAIPLKVGPTLGFRFRPLKWRPVASF